MVAGKKGTIFFYLENDKYPQKNPFYSFSFERNDDFFDFYCQKQKSML